MLFNKIFGMHTKRERNVNLECEICISLRFI